MHSWHTFHGWFYVDVFATKIRKVTLVTASSRHILQQFGHAEKVGKVRYPEPMKNFRDVDGFDSISV